MRVDVLLFAAAREAAGASKLTLDLAEGACVRDVWERLAADHAGLGAVLPSCRAAVDEEFAPPATVLGEGQTVAVLPPVSGG